MAPLKTDPVQIQLQYVLSNEHGLVLNRVDQQAPTIPQPSVSIPATGVVQSLDPIAVPPMQSLIVLNAVNLPVGHHLIFDFQLFEQGIVPAKKLGEAKLILLRNQDGSLISVWCDNDDRIGDKCVDQAQSDNFIFDDSKGVNGQYWAKLSVVPLSVAGS